MPTTDDPAELFRQAERRLRAALFGDGLYESGLVKGDEARARVSRDLRRMQEAFYAAVAAVAEGREASGSREGSTASGSGGDPARST